MPINAELLVHAIPAYIRDCMGAGNWKDVETRRLLWPEIKRPTQVVYFDHENPNDLIGLIPLKAVDVLIEYSWWPEVIRQLAQLRPELRVHVRTHNAEALQQWTRDHVRPWPSYHSIRSVYGAARVLLRDVQCRWRAKTLQGISDWDNRHYWKWLPGLARIDYLPYYCPWPFIHDAVKPECWEARSYTIACMPSGDDRIGRDGLAGFQNLAIGFRRYFPSQEWRFLVTRGVAAARTRALQGCELVDEMEDPWKLLCSVRAVTVLTDLGFGFKTTIMDSIAAGCHILTTPGLSRRLPPAIRERCIIVNDCSKDTCRNIQYQLSISPKNGSSFNSEIRQSCINKLYDL